MLYHSAPFNMPQYEDPIEIVERDLSSITDEDPYIDIPVRRFFTGYDVEARRGVEEMHFGVWGLGAFAVNAATDLADLEMEAICHIYETRDSYKVKEFLKNKTGLLNILDEAYSKILVYFGNFVAVTLEVVDGIEGETDTYLRVGIISCDDVERLLRRLEAFDEGWWLSKLPEVDGDLIFNLDF